MQTADLNPLPAHPFFARKAGRRLSRFLRRCRAFYLLTEFRSLCPYVLTSCPVPSDDALTLLGMVESMTEEELALNYDGTPSKTSGTLGKCRTRWAIRKARKKALGVYLGT